MLDVEEVVVVGSEGRDHVQPLPWLVPQLRWLPLGDECVLESPVSVDD